MSVKIIAVDMDGTFLRSDSTYDVERFNRLYEKMKKHDIRFVVASGNQSHQLKSFFPDIVNEIAFVAENGAHVVDKGETVSTSPITKEEYKRMLNAIKKFPEEHVVVSAIKSAYILSSESDQFFDDMSVYCKKLTRIDSFEDVDDEIVKIYLHCDGADFEKLYNVLNKDIGDIMTPIDCGHFGMDLIVPGINKANGLKTLCERWGFDDSEIMAFGDSGNDEAMLKLAKYSYCVSNGKQAIKDIADEVIKSNDEDAVLEVIEKYLNRLDK